MTLTTLDHQNFLILNKTCLKEARVISLHAYLISLSQQIIFLTALKKRLNNDFYFLQLLLQELEQFDFFLRDNINFKDCLTSTVYNESKILLSNNVVDFSLHVERKIERPSSTETSIQNNIYLHEKIVEIMYSNYFTMKNIISDYQRYLNIDHFSLTVINMSNQIITFSTHPNIDFNLIHLKLWSFDKILSKKNTDNDIIYNWKNDNSYTKEHNKLKFIRLVNNNFCSGITLKRYIKGMQLSYGFASTCNRNLYNEYKKSPSSFINLGDNIYQRLQEKVVNYSLPNLLSNYHLYKTNNNSFLKLLVNHQT